ncbi:M949_RS01915 family surface polysaccharide biosynthesis protein [Commensalibacter communis]|uniref:M949_RS01915 family surface polysaccharide biosynthesis protein n=1 Tax=Commensalibacter communis TaxID=2972786 RepID=UPI00232AA42C|nr:hypothetical protein [Commensalibacter communis]
MTFKNKMHLIKNAIAFIISMVLNPFIAQANTYKKTWNDVKGQHDVILIVEEMASDDLQQVSLSGKGSINNKPEWTIHDFVKDCPVDANITINPKSFENIDLNKTNNHYLLFSYSISCRGGIDPEDIKYFAYQNGQKYTMRGEQTIIIGKDKFGGERKPSISSNLQKNLPLLNYMQKKWPIISTYNYNIDNSAK